MNDPLFNIALLIIVACNLGMLGMYIQMERHLKQDEAPRVIMSTLEHILNRLNKFARDTDYDFRAIKTRMTGREGQSTGKAASTEAGAMMPMFLRRLWHKVGVHSYEYRYSILAPLGGTTHKQCLVCGKWKEEWHRIDWYIQ